MLKENHQLARACDKTTAGWNRFRERAGPDINVRGVHAPVFVGTAAARAQDAGRVRLVHQQVAAELFLDCDQLGQAADIAVHRENAVRDNEGAVGLRAGFDFVPERVGVVVLKALHLHAGEAAGVHQAAVRKAVSDHAVGRAEQRRDHGQVGDVAGGKGKRAFGALEGRELFLCFPVQLERAGQQAHAAGARPIALHCFNRSCVDARVADQPKVVVARQHEHFMPVGEHAGARLVGERRLKWIGVERAGQRRVLKQAARPRIEQVLLLEAPGAAFGEVPVEDFAGRRAEMPFGQGGVGDSRFGF